MFSVVIPLYNKELSIKNTIHSALAQTLSEFEIIVINDGSTDTSLKVVRSIKDPRIRIIDKPNGGVSSARNRGITEARYEWIAFLDGDDIWKPNHLETVKELINKYPNDNVFCTSFIRSTQNFPVNEDRSIEVIENYFDEAIKGHFFWTSIAVINAEVFKEFGGFNELLSYGEDLDLWSRIARGHRFIKSKLVTAVYRIEAENRSNKSFVLQKSRVYNYDFAQSTSEAETRYFKKQIINSMISMLSKRDLRNFFKLKSRHRKHISFLTILKDIYSR